MWKQVRTKSEGRDAVYKNDKLWKLASTACLAYRIMSHIHLIAL